MPTLSSVFRVSSYLSSIWRCHQELETPYMQTGCSTKLAEDTGINTGYKTQTKCYRSSASITLCAWKANPGLVSCILNQTCAIHRSPVACQVFESSIQARNPKLDVHIPPHQLSLPIAHLSPTLFLICMQHSFSRASWEIMRLAEHTAQGRFRGGGREGRIW